MKPQQVPVSDDHCDSHHDDHDEHLKEYSPKEIHSIHVRGILCMVGGCSIHIVLGTFYLWGGISPYIAAYLKSYDSSVTQSIIQIIFPIMGVLSMSSLSFGVKLAGMIGFKMMVFMGGALISLAFLALSFITNLGGFIAIYCIFIGIPSGLVYMLPIICGWKYFPLTKGAVSGVTVAAYGFGAFIFNFVCQAICNPLNLTPSISYEESGKKVKYFDSQVYDNVPFMLRILALSYGILTVIGTLLINYPRDLELYETSLSGHTDKKLEIKNNIKVVDEHSTIIPAECQSIRQGIFSIPFLFLFTMVLSSILFGMLMANSYKVYGLQAGLNDQQLTIVGSCESATNGISRVIWALVLDKIGFKKLYIILVLINILMSGIVSIASNNFVGYLIVLCIIFSAEGGLVASYPVISAQMFGHKVGSIMYGGLFFGIGIANMLGFILYYFLTPIINFEGVFWVVFGINIFSLLVGIFFKDSYDWTK